MVIYFYQFPYRQKEEISLLSKSLESYHGKLFIFSGASRASLGLFATQALQVYQISSPAM